MHSSLNSDEMLQNFLYLYKKKTQIPFFILSNFHFYLLNALVYVDIGIHKGKNESCLKWKTKKLLGFSSLYKYREFWCISLEFKLECKSFILEVWRSCLFKNVTHFCRGQYMLLYLRQNYKIEIPTRQCKINFWTICVHYKRGTN